MDLDYVLERMRIESERDLQRISSGFQGSESTGKFEVGFATNGLSHFNDDLWEAMGQAMQLFKAAGHERLLANLGVDEMIKQHLFCKFRFWFWGCCAIASGQGFMFR